MQHECDECDYKATQRGNLKQHNKSKHDSVRYGCDQCDYTTPHQGYLKVHKINMKV